MKKNLMSVVILALVLVNLILTAILTITVLPETKKANELITQVCSAINLELESGSVTSDASSVPIDKLATYDISDSMTINLKDSGDGKEHYAVITVSLFMNKDSKGYKSFGESMEEKKNLVMSEITSVVSGFTYDEFKSDQQGVQDAIVADLQKLFDSDFIVSVGFPTVTCQ
ncbi:flagellar basal body-associated FliL family protein [Roseburia sp. BX1005]|uniref:Flagellar protein FliL n=1 Tax=Roseburia zhanii TaxID=2763064 RepID=A0A923LNX3_9FIRM|nr:flagellar basal body-associated FliL family protein [Roseburia zhanii]MBC5713281.1 flagellar basal body-associated FliL family protein [Roseburia zhanii]